MACIRNELIFVVMFSCFCATSNSAQENVNKKYQQILDKLAAGDRSIHNCVVSIQNGAGTIEWTGASGTAYSNPLTPMTTDVPYCIASITKLYTATVIMELYEKGMLSLDDPISKYLPQDLVRNIQVYKGKDYSNLITIKDLLSQKSGIPDYYTEKGNDGKTIFDLFLLYPDKRWTVEETIERSKKELKPKFAPGEKAFYSDTNYQLLGKIIESVTNTTLDTAYDEYIFTPLKLTHTHLIAYSSRAEVSVKQIAEVYCKNINITKIRSNGSYWADGGLVSTSQDCIMFLKGLREGKLIRKETLEMMHKWNKIEFPLQYGFGTMYFELPKYMNRFLKIPVLWGHSGSTGSFLYYDKESDMYIAGTINQTGSNMKPFILMSKIIRVAGIK
jgi:D-alanyl-D-alanine carboxypeptidase